MADTTDSFWNPHHNKSALAIEESIAAEFLAFTFEVKYFSKVALPLSKGSRIAIDVFSDGKQYNSEAWVLQFGRVYEVLDGEQRPTNAISITAQFLRSDDRLLSALADSIHNKKAMLKLNLWDEHPSLPISKIVARYPSE